MANTTSSKQLGIFTATSLVIGGMIGSGIFTLPSTLAKFGGIGLSGWLISATGAMVLASIFSKVSKIIPKTGGPFAYTNYAFGNLPAFVVGWGYWLSMWATNCAIALTFTGYLSVFLPILSKPIWTAVSCITVIWSLTLLNSWSVKAGGRMQLTTTILKVIPILIIAIAGVFVFKAEHFVPFNLSDSSSIKAITVSSALCLFAFMGLEAASIPAGNIKNPEKNISKATIAGVLIVIFIYLFSSISLFGILPPAQIENSLAPFSDAAQTLFGANARYLVAAGACISTFGALNGWILIQGQMPLAMAEDGLMPKIFAKRNKNNSPAMGIIMTSGLMTILLLLNQTRSFSNLYSFMVLLTTVTVLISYFATSLVFGFLAWKERNGLKRNARNVTLTLLGLGFSLWMLIGAGFEANIWAGIGLLLGLPFYFWLKNSRLKSQK